jgi:hypothetical protein
MLTSAPNTLVKDKKKEIFALKKTSIYILQILTAQSFNIILSY